MKPSARRGIETSMGDIFHAKRFAPVTPEEVRAVDKEVSELNAEITAVTGAKLTLNLNYEPHAKAVQVLADRIIDLFEDEDYNTTVSLDALELVLRGGVELSMGKEAGQLLDRNLRRFHQELATTQVINLIINTEHGSPKQALEDLVKELKAASEASDKS